MSNYIRRESGGNNDKDHDVLGIVLMIISAFLLLCCAVPVIFGPVSSALQSFFLGVFGIFAYALFAFVFATGLCLVLRRRPSVPGRMILAVSGIALFLMLLLQLITTNAHLSDGFVEYLAAVYGAKWTAGGALFGLIAYGIKAVITAVGAYIVTSLLLAGCVAALVYFVLRDRGLIGKNRPAVKKAEPKRTRLSLPAEDEEPLEQRALRHNSSTALFIEDVRRHGDEEDAFAHDDRGGLYDDDDGDYARLDLIGKRRISQTQASNILYKPASDWEDFDPILASMKRPERKRPEPDEETRPSPGNDYYVTAEKQARETAPEPDVGKATVEDRKKPDKILHGSERGNGLTGLTLPTPKKPEPDTNFNGIVTSNTGGFTDFASDPHFTAYVHGTGISSDKKPFYGSEPEEEKPDFAANDNRDDIVSGDDFVSEHIEPEPSAPETRRPEPKTDRTHITGYEPFGGSNVETFGATGNNIADNNNPIANSDWLVSGGDTEPQSAPEPKPFYDDLSGGDQQLYDTISGTPPIVTEEDVTEAPAPAHEPEIMAQPEQPEPEFVNDAPIVTGEDSAPWESEEEDEVIDLTERRSNGTPTGYVTETPPSVVPPVHTEPVRPAPEPEPVPAPEPEPEPEPYIYERPPLDLLGMPEEDSVVDSADIENKTHAIEEILGSLKFPAKVCNVIVGPSVTRYELQPPQGIPVKKILSLDMDLELTLASGAIRIEAPVANKQVVGIEVANSHPVSVAFREIIDSPAFRDSRGVLPLALGKDIGGDAIVRNLEKMPHLLVAGATNMGKSVCLNTIIVSLIYRSSPEDVRIVLVDPKQIEFTLYRGLPHLLLENPITDVNHAVNALNYLIDEMERRFDLFNSMAGSGYAIRNLEEYNKCELVRSGKMKKIPYIVMVVDELADLMTTRKKDVENGIRRIAQKARAAGIHLVLATQRPSVDIITGSIKVNLPSRISLKVTSNADSRTVLDQGGAESLIGRGDMLLMCNSEPIRLQGAFLTNEEIVSIVSYVKEHNKAIFDKDIEKEILVDQNEPEDNPAMGADSAEESADEKMFPGIMRCFINSGKASTSLIQTRFSLGYARAARIIQNLEMRRWIGPSSGAKPREVLLTEAQFEEVFGVPFNE